MGFFTWRAAKGTKREVQRLRSDLKRQERAANVQMWQQRIDWVEEQVKTLPQEGKDEINALREAQLAKGNFRRFWSSDTFIKEQEKIISKYQVPKGYGRVE